jgi:uncharacterized protein (TIGR03083 family)
VTTLDKPDVLAGLFAVWGEIDTLLAGLPHEQWQAQSPLPGWTVHDVTAHLIGTESMLQGIATPDADIDVSTLKHVRNDIGVMNERWVRKLRGVSMTDMLEKFRAATGNRREALTGMGDDDWNQITATPAGPDTYGRFMRVRDFDGSRVAIELTGPLQRNIYVDVAGRGRVVQDFGGQEPTSTISLDGLLFSRLAGGRTTVAQHPDAVRYGGDEEIGKRVVEHLNYVI